MNGDGELPAPDLEMQISKLCERRFELEQELKRKARDNYVSTFKNGMDD
jgi:hypothetical protein